MAVVGTLFYGFGGCFLAFLLARFLVHLEWRGVIWIGDRILKARLPQLLAELKHEAVAVRILAARRIGLLGSAPEALPDLIECLEDSSADVRFAVASALAQIGEAAQPAVPALTTALTDEDQRARAGAALALATIRGKDAPEAVPVLLAALQHADEEVRQNAALFLGGLGLETEAVVPALVQALQDRVAEVRENAAGALALLGPKAAAAVPALLEARKDRSRQVRDAIEGALSAIDLPLEEEKQTAETAAPRPQRAVAVELPPEIEVSETEDTTRYLLPRRPWGEQGRSFGALVDVANALLVLFTWAWMVVLFLGAFVLKDELDTWFAVLLLVLFVLGMMALVFQVHLSGTNWTELASSSRIELSAVELRLQKKFPRDTWFWGRWSTPQVRKSAVVSRLVTYPLTLTMCGRPVSSGPFRGLAALQLECADGENLSLAFAYPRSWLLALGRTLAGRLGVEHVEGSRQLIAAPVLFKEPPEGASENVSYPPPKSRLVVERRAEGLTLLLQPERGFAVWFSGAFGAVVFLGSAVGLVAAALSDEMALVIVAALGMAFGLLLLGLAWYTSARRIGFTANETGMTAYYTGGPLRSRLLEWQKTDIESIRGETQKGNKGEVRRLVLHTTSGRRVTLFYDMPGDDVPYLATLLRRELGVPAVGVF